MTAPPWYIGKRECLPTVSENLSEAVDVLSVVSSCRDLHRVSPCLDVLRS